MRRMTAEEQIRKVTRGAVEVVSRPELEKKLKLGRPLRVKLGVDPTSPDLHLGHTLAFNRLRAFQDLGHTAVLIIGDFTARIGDPSGRDSTRPTLDKAAIESNARTYQEQAFKVLDPLKTELRYNSEWLEPFMRERLMDALKRCTVQQLMQREDFAARAKAGSPITLLEMLYPLLQGYDSVAIKADVELGGNDQLFNLLMGREMQKDAGQEPQVAITSPLLVGLDGVRKMSKSYGNSIGLNEPPREMFGKVMRVSDELMWMYYELLTDVDLDEAKALHPMEAKKSLAERLTARYHGIEAAREERGFFDRTFSQKELPTDLAPVEVEPTVGTWSQLLVKLGAVPSRKEAQRLIAQRAVKIDGAVIEADTAVASRPPQSLFTLQVGKHRFLRVKVKES
ncbi:MAG: tyrosine--tRNA ligase [Elusimicrobia bacterium]|nr:tyrosine--tRNA ligase [Elusimicrobiota bacterium]